MKYTPRDHGPLFDGHDMIKRKLKERFMTQKELAEVVGMSQGKLSDILRGYRRPTKSDLTKIKDALDIDLATWRKESKSVDSLFPVAGLKL